MAVFGSLILATPAHAAPCPGGALTVVAHEDDDLIFVNPDVIADIRAGRCVRTVFLTAGDAGSPYPDSLYRENGPEAGVEDGHLGQSLSKLWTGAISTMTAVDASESYTRTSSIGSRLTEGVVGF